MNVSSEPAFSLSFEGEGVVPQGESAEAAPSNTWLHHEWASITSSEKEKVRRNWPNTFRFAQ